ncbi:lytic transglycosylase domain-containing protein [Elioraea sp.]|uniref:lytic transglycosylase domain-containing protein n=1 Tax=Elioraea sp. TaxID=2185103 RepID=UPI003F71B573
MARLTAVLVAAGCAADRVETVRTGHVPVIHDYAAASDAVYDPWGPHIAEASALHDVPEAWIREVMERESSGRRRAVSRAGAMGLMQVMPGTWRMLRARHGLGRDPFDPRDNILAGTAYIREMYERFGSPGFLAAYNAGPGAFSRYLARQRPLPRETLRFVAAIAPRIDGVAPASRAAPSVYAAVPAALVSGPQRPRPGPPVQLAARPPARPDRLPARSGPAAVAAALPALPEPTPRREPMRGPVHAEATVPPSLVAEPPSRGFQLMSAAHAATVRPAPPPTPPPSAPRPSGAVAGAWSIQVGAFRTVGPAQSAIERAREAAPDLLALAQPATPNVDTPNGRLVRARLVGLSPTAAQAACRIVERRGQGCFAVGPAARG